VRLLGRSSLTARELSQKLAGRGYAPSEIDTALEALRRCGYVDDRRLAYNVLVWRSSRKGLGRNRLDAELLARGVSESDLRAAWQQAEAEFDEAALLNGALQRFIQTEGPPREKRSFERLARRLIRRGFRKGDVLQALRPYRELAGDGLNDDDDVD
jgi:SOS response regulatory protein OraA/RecX